MWYFYNHKHFSYILVAKHPFLNSAYFDYAVWVQLKVYTLIWSKTSAQFPQYFINKVPSTSYHYIFYFTGEPQEKEWASTSLL